MEYQHIPIPEQNAYPQQENADGKQQVGKPLSVQPSYTFPVGKKTPGEKLFDYTVYGGIGYAINLGLSLAITEFMLHGKGQGVWKAGDKAVSGALKSFMHVDTANKISEISQKYFWLTSGGTVLMLPIKLAEDRKSKFTYLFNRAFFPEVISEDDPFKNLSSSQIMSSRFDENLLPQPIVEQPKNSWLNAAVRRAASVGVVVTWGNVTDKLIGNDKIEKASYDMISKGTKALGGSDKMVKNIRFERYSKWAVLDGINTVITSAVIFLTNGAKEKVEPQTPEMPTIIPAPLNGHSHDPKKLAKALDETLPRLQMSPATIQQNMNAINIAKQKGEETATLPPIQFKDGYAAAMTREQHQPSELSSPSV